MRNFFLIRYLMINKKKCISLSFFSPFCPSSHHFCFLLSKVSAYNVSEFIVFASIMKSSLKWTWVYAADIKSRQHFHDKKYCPDKGYIYGLLFCVHFDAQYWISDTFKSSFVGRQKQTAAFFWQDMVRLIFCLRGKLNSIHNEAAEQW